MDLSSAPVIEVASKEFGKVYFSVIQLNHFDDKRPNYIGDLLKEIDEIGWDAKSFIEMEIVLMFIYSVALMDKVLKENKDVEKLIEEVQEGLKENLAKLIQFMAKSDDLAQHSRGLFAVRMNRYYYFMKNPQDPGPLYHIAREFYLNKTGKKAEQILRDQLHKKCASITQYLLKAQMIAKDTLMKFKIVQEA